MRNGKSDVVLRYLSDGIAYSRKRLPHPYLMPMRYMSTPWILGFACPLPSKISSFYNIVTPLSFVAWMSVIATLILVSLAGIVVNQIYKSMPERTSKWMW